MKKVILSSMLFVFFAFALYSEEQAKDVTVNFNVDEQLSGKSENSYAMTVERLMLFYGSKVDFPYIGLVNSLSFETLKDFGSVNGRMEYFVDFSKHSGRSAGLKIRKFYLMKDSHFRSLLRSYNSQAKRDGKPTFSLKGQNTRWFMAGVRKEFLDMDPEVRKKVRSKSCKSKFVAKLKRLIDKGVPLVWSPAMGGGKRRVKAPIYIISGYNDETKEIIYLDMDKAKPKRMQYEDAWSATTGLYTIKPRVVK